MARVLLDTRCNHCEHVEEDVYDHGGMIFYGDCPVCGEGQMRQIFSTGGINMNPSSSLDGQTGRTSDGTKWTVKGSPRKYDAKTKTWGSQVY